MRIFVKSFLSYWMTTALIVAITVAMILMTRSENRWENRFPTASIPLATLRACAETSLHSLSTRSTNLQATRATAAKCGVLYIQDGARTNLLSAKISGAAQSLAEQVSTGSQLSVRFIPPLTTIIAFDVPYKGNHYVAISVASGSVYGFPPFFIWQLLIAATVSAIAGLVLTRFLVNPIRQLQSSSEAFGRGDMSALPNDSLLKRKDELGELSNTIAQMSARIRSLLSAQRDFLVQVSHELGSPLTRLTVALALARRKAPTTLTVELDRIQSESSELNLMVQQLLRLARLESGVEEEEPETYSINELLLNVCADGQFIANETGKDVSLSQSAPIVLKGYRELVKRAIDNILRNAIRFTPEGTSVEVEVLSPDPHEVKIQIRDCGSGVPVGKLESIFEPFVQGVSGEQGSGAGLGLAIAKQAIQANGGTVRAVNPEGGGLIIEIVLPYGDGERFLDSQDGTLKDVSSSVVAWVGPGPQHGKLCE